MDAAETREAADLEVAAALLDVEEAALEVAADGLEEEVAAPKLAPLFDVEASERVAA